MCAVVVGSLIYLGLAVREGAADVLVFLGGGGGHLPDPHDAGHRLPRASREEADELYGHFRAITGGVKELKFHTRGRTVLIESWTHGPGAQAAVGDRATIYSAAAGWGAAGGLRR